MTTPPLARRERHALCDLALELGEGAPTLCGDWTVKDLVVHLLVRERSPVGAAGILVPPLEGLTERAMARLGRRDFATLVERLRSPGLSVFALPPVEVLGNTLEYVVHHEDLRRAQPGWEPRDLAEGDQHTIWRRLGPMSHALARKVDVPLRLARSDGDASRTVRPGSDPATVVGRPLELALFLFGRAQVRDLDLVGPPATVAAVRAADLGL